MGKAFPSNFVVHLCPSTLALLYMYTVNHKKGGRTFVIITLENLDGFL